MKKILLALIAVVAMATAANAQKALGVRFSGGYGYGAELSFQNGMGSNRLEIDLGLATGDNWTNFSIAGIYQWTGNIAGNLNWYAGVGGRLGLWSVKNFDSDFYLALVGQAGIDYTFDAIPIQLSLDVRPEFSLVPNTEFGWGDISLGARYCF